LSPLRQWWRAREPRERRVLAAGGLVAGLIVLYTGVWSPWQAELARLRVQVPEQRASLAWMQDQLARLGPAAGRLAAASRTRSLPLLTVVEQTAREAGLRDTVRQIQPGEKGEVNVWLQDAGFDTWLQWTDALRGREIEIAGANISHSAQPERVNIRMTVVRYE